ncbi:hypothetical protein KX928_12730 [Roseobacter sp. YSTF-M11]|uniref:ASCH domain-containing protein n=1 Tax=Roseobacter insulae TaxID=2859783 RepID=A0A9X1FVB4_9RHOB|nr:hypothetical protein [Roseobacter insulae]MBW4708650.1 hypothetical protein [Roseobacter insulae]
MVAYSFKKRFSPRIEDGTKFGTIRGERKRHARVGEPVQLYEAMRTKYCRKIIPDPICTRVEPIRIHVEEDKIAFVHAGPFVLDPQCQHHNSHLNRFARADGFDDMADFHTFWFREYGIGVFRGVWILWGYSAEQEILELAA